MTDKEIIEAVKKHTDKYGLVQTGPGEISGNGILYTAEMYIILNRLNLLSEVDRYQLKRIIRTCQRDLGLYNRVPEGTQLEAQDDYIGLMALAHEMGWGDIAQEVLDYGSKKCYYNKLLYLRNMFNNKDPGVFSINAWLGRFPQVMAHFSFAANKLPSLFQRLYFSASMLLSLFKASKPGDHDYWMLSWLMAHTAKGKSFICDLAIKVFAKRLNTVTNGEGIGRVSKDYFNKDTHPISQTWSLIKL